MSEASKLQLTELTTIQKLKVAMNGPGRNVSFTPTLWITEVPELSARKGAGHPATARGSQFCSIGPSTPYSALSSVTGLNETVATEAASARSIVQRAFIIH